MALLLTSKPMATRAVRRAVRPVASARRAPAQVAAFVAAPAAMAASEVAQVAIDGRLVALPLVLAPALGWVLFNILGPASNQIANMQKKQEVSHAATVGFRGSGCRTSFRVAP